MKEYQVRIVNASRKELLVINYELLRIEIEEAIASLEKNDPQHVEKSIGMAQKFLRELSDSLNFEYSISKELMSLYIYMNKLLVEAQSYGRKEALEEVKGLLNMLLDGWEQMEEIDEEPVIVNGQKVYAGLTYGKNNLNESVDTAPNRGFKA